MITFEPLPHLDGSPHRIFGRAVNGMDIIRRIEETNSYRDYMKKMKTKAILEASEVSAKIYVSKSGVYKFETRHSAIKK